MIVTCFCVLHTVYAFSFYVFIVFHCICSVECVCYVVFYLAYATKL